MAVLGNKFWLNRTKHGRSKIFSTPALLWEAACEYFEWCENNPLIEVDFRGKDATEVKLPKMRAFTYEGLTLYLDVNVRYFNDFEISLAGKTDEKSIEFSIVIARIRQVITSQQFTGAASGFLKENIIARYLGLKDKTDMTTDDNPLNGLPVNVNDRTSLIQEIQRINSILNLPEPSIIEDIEPRQPRSKAKKGKPKIVIDNSKMPRSKTRAKAEKINAKASKERVKASVERSMAKRRDKKRGKI